MLLLLPLYMPKCQQNSYVTKLSYRVCYSHQCNVHGSKCDQCLVLPYNAGATGECSLSVLWRRFSRKTVVSVFPYFFYSYSTKQIIGVMLFYTGMSVGLVGLSVRLSTVFYKHPSVKQPVVVVAPVLTLQTFKWKPWLWQLRYVTFFSKVVTVFVSVSMYIFIKVRAVLYSLLIQKAKCRRVTHTWLDSSHTCIEMIHG